MPSSPFSFIDADRHARDYWDVDGLPALVAGCAAVLLGLLLLPGWTTRQVLIGLYIGALVFAECENKVVQMIKTRVTYPRTGYVAPINHDTATLEGDSILISIRDADTAEALRRAEASRARQQHSLRAVVVSFLIAPLFLASILVGADNVFNRSPVLLRAALLCMAAFAMNRSAYRFTWLEVCGFPLIALLVSILPGQNSREIGCLLVASGVLPLTRGAVTLLRYRRLNPASTE